MPSSSAQSLKFSRACWYISSQFTIFAPYQTTSDLKKTSCPFHCLCFPGVFITFMITITSKIIENTTQIWNTQLSFVWLNEIQEEWFSKPNLPPASFAHPYLSLFFAKSQMKTIFCKWMSNSKSIPPLENCKD